jgi:MoaA/NifB/PqqE/SkfB family radical SAM enzyme
MLQLTGGEPLLNPDFFEMVKHAKSLGMLVFAPTNGTLINECAADRLKESKIDQVSISLHHYDAKAFEKSTSKKGILETVVNSIKLLNQRKVPYQCFARYPETTSRTLRASSGSHKSSMSTSLFAFP